MHLSLRIGTVLLLLSSAWVSDLSAKTRWSTFHCIPDADLIEGGDILFDANGYFPVGSPDGMTPKPSGMLTVGVIEYVNISGGYAGGATFGLKARILGETKEWMPSLAIGVKNIFSHEESYWYNATDDSMSNEIYCALGKGIENLRLRMVIGVQSIPNNELDKVNPFAGVEKYFGNGLYLTFEFFRRQKEYVMALLVDWRFLKRRAELYAGVVDIAGMISGKNKDGGQSGFVQPGIRGGIRFNLKMKLGKSEGFTTLEDRLAMQTKTIQTLKNDVDSLSALMKTGGSRMEGISRSLKQLEDSASSNDDRYRTITLEKLATLKDIYEQEPFEPEQVKKTLRELVVHRDNIVPVLLDVALDKKEDTRIRTLAISTCGEIGTSAAKDILIEILGQVQVPEHKIEALIALGKLQETRATFLMQQLAADPNDAIAFTATEVLQKLEKETGIQLSSPPGPVPGLTSIPENKIGVRSAGSTGLNEVIDETKRDQKINQPIQKIEKREFSESVVSPSVDKEVPVVEEPPAEVTLPQAASEMTVTDEQQFEGSDTANGAIKNTQSMSDSTEVADTVKAPTPAPLEGKEAAKPPEKTNSKIKTVKEKPVEAVNW